MNKALPAMEALIAYPKAKLFCMTQHSLFRPHKRGRFTRELLEQCILNQERLQNAVNLLQICFTDPITIDGLKNERN